MAKVTFRMRSKDEEKTSSIYVRLQNGRNIRPEIRLKNVFTKPKYWDSKSMRVINTPKEPNCDIINDILARLESYILKDYIIKSNDDSQQYLFDGDWLRKLYYEFSNQPNKFSPHLVFFRECAEKWQGFNLPGIRMAAESGNACSKKTISSYSQAINSVTRYDKSRNTRTKINNMNLQWLSDYKKFMFSEEKYNNGTVKLYLEKICTILRESKDLFSIPMHDHINSKRFSIPKMKKKFDEVFVNFEMLEHLYLLEDCKFKESHLKTRDWFIIGCCTGMRGSDLMRLTIDQVDFKHNTIRLKTKKRDRWVVVPLHAFVKDILQKRGNQFPGFESIASFDKKVKTVCEVAGFKDIRDGSISMRSAGSKSTRSKDGKYPFYKLVASHTCRRSFATNYYKRDGFEDDKLLLICGWTDIKMITHYVKDYRDTTVDRANDYMERNFAKIVQKKNRILRKVI